MSHAEQLAGCPAEQRGEELAEALEDRAAERAQLGDAREANVLRARAAAVREGKPDPGWS